MIICVPEPTTDPSTISVLYFRLLYFVNELFDTSIEFNFFFRYMEAAPQLFLQLYIAYKSDDVTEGNYSNINILSINQ